MRVRERGFTLIELMIVVAIIGILASIAIPTFTAFASKSRKVEARLAIDKLTKDIRIFHGSKSTLPPDTNVMPDTAACGRPSNKTPSTVPADWYADPGWKAIGFHLVEAGYYQYSWTKTSDTSGTAQATGDLNCDGIPSLFVVDVSTSTGNVFEAIVTEID
jgi:prepilin-type N-terminal cleavage/methylation domain-containing protein